MTRKYIYPFTWSVIILVNVYFIYNFPLRYFNCKAWLKPFGPLLLTHIVFGIIALLAGPVQFFPSIRKQYLKFHRTTGKIYLLSVLMGAVSAMVLAVSNAIITQNRIIFGTGLIGLSVAWLLTSGMALSAIKNGNLPQHREWMIRSYVVTCGFTTFRIFAVTLTSYLHLPYEDMSQIMAWACWSVPLLFTEIILQARNMRQSNVLLRTNL